MGWGYAAGAALQLGNMLLNQVFDAEAASRQYDYQRALNQQGYDLSQQSFLDTPTNYRAGLEKAGYNPLLAVSTSNVPSFSGGSSSAVRSTPTDMSNFVTNAYQTFKLNRDKNKAEIENINNTAENQKAQADYYKEQARLAKYQKLSTFAGDVLEKVKSGQGVNAVKDVYGEIVKPKMTNAKRTASDYFWNLYDKGNDAAIFLKDLFSGSRIPYKYYQGITKNLRIKNGEYTYKDLFNGLKK